MRGWWRSKDDGGFGVRTESLSGCTTTILVLGRAGAEEGGSTDSDRAFTIGGHSNDWEASIPFNTSLVGRN